jgi:hypothetical protein
MSNTKIETAISQGVTAAREFAKTGEHQKNPFRRGTIESGWFDHGFRVEIKRIDGLSNKQ